jgi:hypothetical protein
MPDLFQRVLLLKKSVIFREVGTDDLKLVADALFANGVNQIVWHGMPFNPTGVDSIRFYASVHVGKTGTLSPYLRLFNEYLTSISRLMRSGKTYTDVAVYLPLEDAWIEGEYPAEKQMEWSWGAYELRYVQFPAELKGYPAMWVNQSFLERLSVNDNGIAQNSECSFRSLVVDARYLDIKTLSTIRRLAQQGFFVVFLQTPHQAGKNSSEAFDSVLEKTLTLPNVYKDCSGLRPAEPLVSGSYIPEFWCRETTEGLVIFFAHPAGKELSLPVEYAMRDFGKSEEIPISFRWKGKVIPYILRFEPHKSLLIKLTNEGTLELIQIPFGSNR